MAKRVAKFEKVTYGQFEKDWLDTFDIPELDTSTRREIESIYGAITLPKRATKGSAGYDFVSPLTFTLKPGETIKIPTGIRCGMNTDWVLMLYPRSGLGFKYRLQLDNLVGIIDSDYFYSDNEGHIFVKLTNDSKTNKIVTVRRGDAFMQGIFVEYGITEDDKVETSRNGGFGSTDKNKGWCNIEAKESNNIISDENGALIIINILYEQGIINKRTYDNILKKYKIT